MRQPTSVYVRFARRSAARLYERIRHRVQRVISPKCDKASKPRRELRAIVDEVTLKAALQGLGISLGDTVMVHSGISHLGKVVGGPRAIFEHIRERVGDNGHVLYPVFPFGTLMFEYLKSNPAFDARTAPSKMGALTEYALRMPGGLRSVHPTHSVLAFGPRSAELVGDHHLCPTPFGARSPFARLVEFGGKILLIGVGLNSTTSFHRTEDRLGDDFSVKVYLPGVFRIRCVDTSGVPCEVVTASHDPFVSRVRDCDLVKREFLQAGILREVQVGEGVVSLIDARAMDRLLEDLWRSQRKTIYGKVWG